MPGRRGQGRQAPAACHTAHGSRTAVVGASSWNAGSCTVKELHSGEKIIINESGSNRGDHTKDPAARNVNSPAGQPRQDPRRIQIRGGEGGCGQKPGPAPTSHAPSLCVLALASLPRTPSEADTTWELFGDKKRPCVETGGLQAGPAAGPGDTRVIIPGRRSPASALRSWHSVSSVVRERRGENTALCSRGAIGEMWGRPGDLGHRLQGPNPPLLPFSNDKINALPA